MSTVNYTLIVGLLYGLMSTVYAGKEYALVNCHGEMSMLDQNDAFAESTSKRYKLGNKHISTEDEILTCQLSPEIFLVEESLRFLVCSDFVGNNPYVHFRLEIDKINSGLFDFRVKETFLKKKGDFVYTFQGLCSIVDN